MLLISDAGNNSYNNREKHFYPIDYDEKHQTGILPKFIKVGGITFNGDKKFSASFTNYGQNTVAILASSFS